MSEGARPPTSPPPVRPPGDREQAILDLARRLVLEHPGSVENGEEVGLWYKMRGAPEVIRREFLKVTGREHLLDERSGREVELHLPSGDEKLFSLTIWFRNGDRLRDFVACADLGGFFRPMLSMVAATLPSRRKRRVRRRPREASTVARVLAIHYLSRRGGGERTLEQAAELYRASLDDALTRNRRAGRRQPRGWRTLPDGWRAERSRVLTELWEDLGPL
ncbi:MAG: hypothetical protein IVW53_13130 [Chloroflexi bacterium]|nr:hypothetical protein [Chloroflexota bacterium]